MEVIPAVDLKGGWVVCLYQGDFKKESVFSENPVETARRWEKEGASRLHLVDLDGAAVGEPRNLSIIEKIVGEVHIPVQVGGGVRETAALEHYLSMGVERVVLGTAAVEDSGFVAETCRRHGDAIVIGVDARDGFVATSGWTRQSSIQATEFVGQMEDLGARRFIYTDISRNGTLSEPNFEAVSRLISLTRSAILCSGGISSVRHLVRLKEMGMEGAIVGRALYTGDIGLPEAIEAVAPAKQAQEADFSVRPDPPSTISSICS
ncbi:MAG: 1-(5-phosphoribosyl)-5-[(5-phosphoribosylamino)methylideneamino]imidazole-4-carboxamide isomerase [Dehalococcoidia bacterium]